jgi:hypothetical protein
MLHDISLADEERACIALARAVYIMTGNVERFGALATIARSGVALVMIDVEVILTHISRPTGTMKEAVRRLTRFFNVANRR